MDLKRGLSADEKAVLAGVFHPVLLTYIAWPGDVLRAHTGFGDLLWDSQTWVGLSNALIIDGPADGQSLGVLPATVSVVGISADLFTALGVDVRNIEAKFWWACVTEPSGTTLSVQPQSLYFGRVDANRLTLNDGDGEKTLGVELDLRAGGDLRSGAAITHSYEDQISKHTGDTGGQHLPNNQIIAENTTWPED